MDLERSVEYSLFCFICPHHSLLFKCRSRSGEAWQKVLNLRETWEDDSRKRKVQLLWWILGKIALTVCGSRECRWHREWQWKKGLSAALWNDSSWFWSGETWTSFAIEWIAYNQFTKRRQANAICGLDHSTQLSRGVRFWVNVYMWDNVSYCNSVAHGVHMHIQVHLKSCTKIRLCLDHSYSILTCMQMLATAMRLHLLQPLLPSHCPEFCWIAMGNTRLCIVVSTLLSVSFQVEKPQLAHTWQRT
jgi:hypothetical protein